MGDVRVGVTFVTHNCFVILLRKLANNKLKTPQ